MKLYTEDLICRLGNEGQYIFAAPLSIFPMDAKVVNSLAQNPTIGKGYTEKQRQLVIRLCQKYRGQLISELGPAAEIAINNPEFKFPLVESAPQEKSITVQGKEILVKFPYNENLVGVIRKYRDTSTVKLCEWDSEEKCWRFALEEKNIFWLATNVLSSDFSVDEDFSRFFQEITEVMDNIESYLPMVAYEDNKFVFKNVHPKVPQPESSDVAETLLLAKYYGISTWDENVEKMKENAKFSPILTSFLQETKPNSLEFDINENPADQLKELFKYNLPALIIIPGYNEFFTLKSWALWLKAQGISEKDISVMFRLPNGTGSLLNDFIKQEGLNNPVEENTKVVFVSQKIPKPLIKAEVDFKIILNLGSLSGVHYSITTYLNDRPDVIRLTDKNKTGYQFGLL